MVNTDPCSMGGIIDYGVCVTTKSSPRSVAIDKAQEELRQECDVREERRRELEFLEKGGNPLDFKFGHVESVSVQSTSLTDQLAEQNVISEAKGSFAFAASPYGDSVESSDQPGSSLCRETNTADNLMLFGGDNNIVKEKVVKRGSRRTNAAQLRQSYDGHTNTKKAEDSGLSRLGVKSQAYVRRNRSKSCRESANVASITSPVVPAKGSESKDAKGVIKEKQADKLGVLSGSNLKQGGPKCENAPKNPASNDHVVMELNGIQTIRESHCIVKSEARQGDNNSKSTEVPFNDVNGNQQTDGCGEMAAAGASEKKTDATSKVVLRPSYSSASTQDESEKVDYDHLDKGTAHIHAGELDKSSIIPVCATQAATLHKNAMDTCEDMTSIIDNHADSNDFVAMKVGGKSDKDLDISRISSKGVKEGGQLEGFSRPTSVKENSNSAQPEMSTTVHVKDEMEVCDDGIVEQNDTIRLSPGHSMNNEGGPALDGITSCHGDTNSAHPIVVGSALNTLPDSTPSLRTYGSILEGEIKRSGENLNKMAHKEYEDSILRKACLIEVGLKGACERSPCNISLERRRKGHWDFVLEEMAWMANDFMQERLWRTMAASQVCHWIASDGLAKFDQASIQRKQKTVIRSLAKGVMSFWRSAETILTTGGKAKVIQEYDSNMLGEAKPAGIKDEKEQGNESMETSMRPRRSQIQDYAVRFLEYNSHTSDSVLLAEAPPTPDRLNDFGILKVSNQLSQESLFYAVTPGAMLAYRESVESLFIYHKKVGNTEFKYDYEASVCDSAADLAQENAYEEDEGETCAYLLPEAYDAGLLSKMGHKKKHIMQQRISGARPYEISTDVPYEPYLESKSGNQQLFSNGKRPSSFLAIPTKRVRTAARQRVVSPFPASVGGIPQVTCQTDVSSGDTNSYQDDQSSLHSGSLPWKNMDYESTVDFDRQLPYDGSEVWTKPNKKKKHKNPGYKTAQTAANSRTLAAVKGRIYDQRSQIDSITQYEQKDFLKKRSETGHFYSNGSTVANGGHHASKKLKIMKQGIDISQASPIASQMSNMANPAKIIKIITNRDRGRKVKALKMSSGGGWSNFEDQALVVLVHDMGQNWELVSDAINNIVQFKSVHRQPKECKERYKLLVDKNSGDGADSGEDSGSSQHYHFTIPGIPKGSARQLFQRLQGPFEEENLKSHFEKIMLLMPQVQSRRRQINSRELKPIIQPHSSHVVAFSQACPNNLSGAFLTPLDLCDTISPNLDASAHGSGYQGSHTNGLTLLNHHGSIGPAIPTSNPNSRLPGSPGIVLGSNLPSPSTSSAPSRDAQKYGLPRSISLQGDEQQKIQYNQMLTARNLQQSGDSVPGACPGGADRGVRMMPGAHGVGMTTGVNRGMPGARAGFPRVSSPGMVNMVSSGNMLPNSGQGMQNAANVHSGAKSAPGNSMLRPRDPMQMHRPGQHMEEHKQMARPEFQMQVSQGSSQAVHSSSTNSPFSNAAASLPVQQAPKPHQMSQPSHMFKNPHHSQTQGTSRSSPQQQAHVMHLANERQFEQRMQPQQHNDLSGASAVPSVQNGSQTQQQNQASAATSTPSSQPLHQRQPSAQNPPDSSAVPKQKKQQCQQQPRQNQQQRNQGSQQAKLMKSLGRGNMLITQTPPVDTHPSIVSTPSKSQVSDRNQMQHGQGSSPGDTVSIPSMPQPGNQHKLHTSPLPQLPKQLPDIGNQGLIQGSPSHIGNQGLMQGSPSHTLLALQQPPLHCKSPLTTQQRQINPSQNSIQRMMTQQIIQNSDCRRDSQIDQVQHNQMIPTTPISHSTESGSPGLSSLNQKKHEASSHDPTAVTSTSKLLSSPEDNFVGIETSLPSSSQIVPQRHISGGLPMHGQDVGGQWHQQQSRQHLQSLHQQPQHQQRPVVPGSLYSPSNSGPG